MTLTATERGLAVIVMDLRIALTRIQCESDAAGTACAIAAAADRRAAAALDRLPNQPEEDL